jgi:hypothetical protein
MKPADRDDTAARRPGIVPLRPLATGSLADLIEDAVASVVAVVGSSVQVTCDVDPRLNLPGPASLVRDAVAPLVAAAADAAGRPRGASDFPVVDEIVITSVDTGTAIEIEIANSGGDRSNDLASAVPAATRTAVARLGGSLTVRPCPEGGCAVTICVPRRRAHGAAA